MNLRLVSKLLGIVSMLIGGAMFFDHKGNLIKRLKNSDTRNPYEVEHAELVKHIRQDKPINNAYYTADSTMTSIFGRMATYSGKELSWDEAVASKVSLLPENVAWDADPKVLPGEDGLYPTPTPGITEVL